MREGLPGEAIVVGVRTWPSGTIGISRHTVQLRLTLDDATVVERKLFMTSKDLSGATPEVGDRLPVRYDASEPARFDVDFDAVRAAQEREEARLDAEALQRAEQKG